MTQIRPPLYQGLLTLPCTVTRYAPGTPDDRGDTPLVGTSSISTCMLQQVNSVESVDGNDVQTTTWRLFLPADCADLSGQDRVTTTADGYVYELVGDPNTVVDPRRGWVHHVLGTVKRIF
jgi:hypothetical protein